MAGSDTASDIQDSHRRFLNAYYGISRHFYDATRRYYLFGRDEEIRALIKEPWQSLIEIGPGTGRNLRKLHSKTTGRSFGGVEASDAMLDHARERCPWASLVQGFAESTDLTGVLGRPVDRILYSYCLSMVHDRRGALENSLRGLAPGGEVVIVDFGDFQRLPFWFSPAMERWLETFHVDPVDPALLQEFGARVTWGAGRYYFRARIRRE